jgi:hypothetical protein
MVWNRGIGLRFIRDVKTLSAAEELVEKNHRDGEMATDRVGRESGSEFAADPVKDLRSEP